MFGDTARARPRTHSKRDLWNKEAVEIARLSPGCLAASDQVLYVAYSSKKGIPASEVYFTQGGGCVSVNRINTQNTLPRIGYS